MIRSSAAQKMEFYSSKKKKTHQSTKNVFFMSHLNDIFYGRK
jgi:hypothetical protein